MAPAREYEFLTRLYSCHRRFVPHRPPKFFQVLDNARMMGIGTKKFNRGLAAVFDDQHPYRYDRFTYKVWTTWGEQGQLYKIYQACRWAIRHQIRTMGAADNQAVDHAPPWPFSRIIDAWLETHEPVIEEMAAGDQLAPASERSFLHFHDARAKLRIVDRDLNSRWQAHGYERRQP
jgi:hypothetical protein